MNTNLQVFNFENSSIRTVELDGVIWFVAKDVATSLGYDNTAQAVRTHCRKAKALIDMGCCSAAPTLDSQTKLIPESDVYRLTMKSQLESAEKFQDWVTEEVLPSIRKTGQYKAPALTQSEWLIQQAVLLDQQAKAVAKIEEEQKQQNLRLQSVEARIDSSTGYTTVKAFCKLHNIHCPLRHAKLFGKDLAEMCREHDLPIGRVSDEVFGSVNSYPITLMEEYFELNN